MPSFNCQPSVFTCIRCLTHAYFSPDSDVIQGRRQGPTFHPLPSLLNVIDFKSERETDKTVHIRKRLHALASTSNCTHRDHRLHASHPNPPYTQKTWFVPPLEIQLPPWWRCPGTGSALDGFVSYKHAVFHSTSHYLMDWSCVDLLWIIVMFLSAVWILILTAPIHCRGSIGEQVMQCKISSNLFRWRNKLIYIFWPEGVYIFSKSSFLMKLSFKQ